MQETQVQSLGQEDLLEKGMAPITAAQSGLGTAHIPPPSLPVRQMGVEEVFVGQARSQISLEGLGESPGQTLIPRNLWRLRA